METLPNHIRATRRGIGESDYDAYGQLAPLQWRCRCGSVIFLEIWDHHTEEYIWTPKAKADQFLADHSHCPAKQVRCYSCKEVEVEQYGDWCAVCSDNSDWY